MTNRIWYLLRLFLLLPLSILTSCEENIDEEEEYVDWKAKNTTAFVQQLDEAKQAIAQAKATYGEAWTDHCPWRVFRTYAQDSNVAGKAADSICVKIVESGTSDVSPMYTDSVQVNYLLRILPSRSYDEGKIVSHSGPIASPEEIFNPDFAKPAGLLTSNTIEGFTTALLHMHVGDRWMVYIPYELGYGAKATSALPACSMLIYDMQLVQVAR